ncbi:MAG TPA: hypothetical protein VMW69_11790 [Spirochaetia bacterium]|nr:hypothetical protein [Spirochaetia bacterium]
MNRIDSPRKGSRRLLAAVALLIMSVNGPAAEPIGQAEYVEMTGSKRLLLTSWELPKSDGILLESRSENGEQHEVFVDKSLETRWWDYRDPAKGIDIHAQRNGSAILVNGTLKGKPIERREEIDSASWYQSIERSLESFALAPAGTTMEFWILQPDTLRARKIQARTEGVDRLMIEGRSVSAARVRISLPGFLAAFWSSSYWYRLSDGKFVRFEGLHGPPGSPLTTVELIRSRGTQ